MNKFIIYANGTAENHGCEAISRSTIKLFGKENVEILTFDIQKEKKFKLDCIVKLYQVYTPMQSFATRMVNKLIKVLFHTEKFYFFNIYKSFRNHNFSKKISLCSGGDNYCYKNPEWIDYLTKVIKRKGGNAILWGCSVEPLFMTKDFLNKLNEYDYIFTRESISYNALLEKDFPKNKLFLFPDPAFVLDYYDIELPQNFILDQTVGINISPMILEYGNNEEDVYNNYLNLAKYIIENTKYNIAFISHVSSDDSVNQKIIDDLNYPDRIIFFNSGNDCIKLKSYISKLKMFIGARTHSTIAAYSTYVPTLVVGYSVKSKGIAKDIFGTYENYVVSVNDLKNEYDLTRCFCWLDENCDEIKKHLMDFIPTYIQRTESIKSTMSEIYQ